MSINQKDTTGRRNVFNPYKHKEDLVISMQRSKTRGQIDKLQMEINHKTSELEGLKVLLTFFERNGPPA